jgi:4-aminobutyrate aminotransferase-like enzyme
MAMVNAFDPEKRGDLAPAEAAIVARRNALLGPAYRLFYEKPVHIVRGEGVWLYGPEGEAYLDLYNNVASVGHCHPHVVEALARQAAVLNTHTRYLNEGIIDYAERLLGTFPREVGHAMFACSGSEANDLAVRIAKAHTGGTGFIVTRLAYHGTTDSIAAMSPSLGSGVKLGDHVRTIPAPDTYRFSQQDMASFFANGVRSAMADMEANNIKPAALLVDTIFSSDGVFADPAGFLAPAVGAIREAGGLFIADEVQAGFGRTGEGMWGFSRHNLIPDIVTMGKPMGNGHPVSAVVVKPEVVEAFGRASRYFNTFGGNPVSCAVGMAVLDVIEREKLIQNAREVGDHLQAGLRSLSERHSLIGDVRGAGLFIGVELVRDRAKRTPAPEEASQIVNGLRERRVLISATGPGANVLKIRPPLVLSRENADLFLETLSEVLTALPGA